MLLAWNKIYFFQLSEMVSDPRAGLEVIPCYELFATIFFVMSKSSGTKFNHWGN